MLSNDQYRLVFDIHELLISLGMSYELFDQYLMISHIPNALSIITQYLEDSSEVNDNLYIYIYDVVVQVPVQVVLCTPKAPTKVDALGKEGKEKRGSRRKGNEARVRPTAPSSVLS